MNELFSFKQFSIAQDRCAMKVGTDGVLLGAWVNSLTTKGKILDVGCGTALISLMLAQRSPLSEITGIEIDPKAAVQARENVEQSKYSNQIRIFQTSLQGFTSPNKFDLIVSNPPFYQPNARMDKSSRKTARHTTDLTFQDILECSFSLLNNNGLCNIIIPFNREIEFIEIGNEIGFYPKRITRVRGRKEASLKRSLVELSKVKCPLDEDELTIEIERHQYTAEYKKIVSPFYLKM